MSEPTVMMKESAWKSLHLELAVLEGNSGT
jgi:hypothetical protein